jgi:hypothetical protein
MSVLTQYLPSAPPPPPVVLARGDAFFVRRVALAEGEPVEAQVTLALEGMAPFPPEQLYHGHLPAADGRSALVFAAFRRRFEAADTEAWTGAALVTPDFVPLLVTRPTGAGVTLRSAESLLTALAWAEGEDLPSAVVVRAGGPEHVVALLDEVRARTGLAADAELRELTGDYILKATGEGEFSVFDGDKLVAPLPAAWPAGADVRDPEFLAARRRAAVRDLWLWRGLLGSAAVLALAAFLHLGSGGLGLLTRQREARVETQKPVVAQIDAAQMLANRIAELSEKRLMPFEMMAAINPARPGSVVFQRLVTRGLLGLEVEAQAVNPEDVGAYANALKTLPAVASVQTREVRARDGVTSFVLALEFKPDVLKEGGAL